MAKKLPGWYAARARARGVRVGQVVWTPSDVVALIDRVHVRYQALANAVALTPADEDDPLGIEWREAWAAQYRGWLDFRQEGRGVWGSAWGSTASTAQAFDQELDAFRSEYEARTGEEVPGATSSTAEQGRRGSLFGSFFTGAGAGVAVTAAAAVAVAIALSRAR